MLENIRNEIDRRLESVSPDVFDSLYPPATKEDFSALNETLLLERLPQDLVTLYKWHNGQSNSCTFHLLVLYKLYNLLMHTSQISPFKVVLEVLRNETV